MTLRGAAVTKRGAGSVSSLAGLTDHVPVLLTIQNKHV